MRKIYFFFFIILFVGVVIVFPQRKINFQISLTVQSVDNELRNKVDSYISRELRSLGDVNITSSGEFYQLIILAQPQQLKNGEPIGFSLAVVINYQSTCVGIDQKPYPCYVFSALLAYSGSDSVLRDTCEQIVTDLDTSKLQPLRKLYKEK